MHKQAREHCKAVGDFVARNIFAELLTDAEGHIDFPETQLGRVANLGEEKNAQLNASKMDDAR